MKYFTKETGFFGRSTPQELVAKYGSPLYVYSETILRRRCRDMKSILPDERSRVSYSAKANANLELLRIVRSEGIDADAMSPGEIHVLKAAGFQPEEILYVGNNVSTEELRYAIAAGVTVSVDSLSQLERFGRINPGGRVAVRFNPGVGAGHHEKVVTGGKKTKFHLNPECIPEVKTILARHGLQLIGINQHIGSLFLEGGIFFQSVKVLLEMADHFSGLEFIDFGGGFGISYRKQSGEARLDLDKFGSAFRGLTLEWRQRHNWQGIFRIEPGRYIPAESGVLLGTVHALKENGGTTYIGTDLGFNVLMRPVLYSAHHEIEVYRDGKLVTDGPRKTVSVVGNICETGDIMAKDRELPTIQEEDLIGVMDAGAYGYAMSNSYNNRLRPAEVLITAAGENRLIRRRDTFADLMAGFTG